MRIVFAIAVLALTAAIPVGADEEAAQAVQWNWQLVPASPKPGTEAELVVVAKLAPQWVVYASDFESGSGPLPARIKVKKNTTTQLLEPLRSVGAKRKKDPTFNAEYGYFSGQAELRQKVRLPADGAPLEVTLNGQACYEADGTCHLIRQEIRLPAG